MHVAIRATSMVLLLAVGCSDTPAADESEPRTPRTSDMFEASLPRESEVPADRLGSPNLFSYKLPLEWTDAACDTGWLTEETDSKLFIDTVSFVDGGRLSTRTFDFETEDSAVSAASDAASILERCDSITAGIGVDVDTATVAVRSAASWVEIDFHDTAGKPFELRLDVIGEFVAMRTLAGDSREAIERNAVWFDALVESTNSRLDSAAAVG